MITQLASRHPEAMDSGSYKSALQQCNKFLKKQPNHALYKVGCDSRDCLAFAPRVFHIARVYQRPVIYSRSSVSPSVARAVKTTRSKHMPYWTRWSRPALRTNRSLGRSAMQFVPSTDVSSCLGTRVSLQGLTFPRVRATAFDAVALFDDAYKKAPQDEELGAQAFMSHVRVGNWKAAQVRPSMRSVV